MDSENENNLIVMLCTGGEWQLVNGLSEYLPAQSLRRALRLPFISDFKTLKKFCLQESRFKFK